MKLDTTDHVYNMPHNAPHLNRLSAFTHSDNREHMNSHRKSWTEHTPDLVRLVTKGVRAVMNRYAKHAVEFTEDITQDVLLDIQSRYFSKGRTVHEGQVRTIIRQDTLNHQRRKYHPAITEDMKLATQRQLSRMIETGVRTTPNGYTTDHLTEAELTTVKQLHENDWSPTATSKATGIPLGTLQSRLSGIHYKQSTYNNRHQAAYPSTLSQEAEHSLTGVLACTHAHKANTQAMLAELMETTTTLNEEDKKRVEQYLAGDLALNEIRTATRKMKDHARRKQ